MSFIEENDIFINRCDDLKEVGGRILEAKNNTVFIIFSRKGAGKTEFINKLTKEYNQRHKSLTVEYDSSGNSLNGKYIQLLFSEITKDSGLDVDQYFRAPRNQDRNDYINFSIKDTRENSFLHHMSKALLWMLPFGASLLGLSCFKIYENFEHYGTLALVGGMFLLLFSLAGTYLLQSKKVQFRFLSKKKRKDVVSMLSESVGSPALNLQVSFIKHKLKQGGYLLHLMNVQEMDCISRQALAQCIVCEAIPATPNVYLMEYLDFDIFDVKLFKKSLAVVKDAPDIDIYSLPKLSERHILELAENFISLNADIELKIREFWSTNQDGNIFELLRYLNELSNVVPNNTISLETAFQSTTRQQKLLLMVLICCKGKADIQMVMQIVKESIPDIKAQIKLLLDQGLITLDEQTILCKQEIVSEWENLYSGLDIIVNSAISLCEHSLWNQLKEEATGTVNYFYALEKLLHISIAFHIKGLLPLLTHITTKSKQAYDRAYLLKCFRLLLESFSEKADITTAELLPIISCAYDLELYDMSHEFLQLCPSDVPETIAFKAMLYHRLNKHERVVEYCRSKYSKEKESRLDFVLKQIEMISLRMLYRIDECWNLFEELMYTPIYKQYYEYGVFLRNAEMVVDIQSSIDYLKQSITYFRLHKDKKNQGISQLSYGMQLARLGKYRQAIIAIKRAQKKLQVFSTLDQHYFSIDLAAVYLLQQKKSKNILYLLDRSELTAYIDFDRLVILVNKLAYCILTQDLQLFSWLVSLVEQKQIPQIIQVLRSIYYNIAIMYRTCNDPVAEEKYISLSKLCHEQIISKDPRLPLNTLWDARYSRDVTKLPHELYNMYACPYHVSFISFWHFDIPDF